MNKITLIKNVLLTCAVLGVLNLSGVAQIPAGHSAQRPGSLLFYNIYTSDVGVPEQQNTRLNLTNTANESINVHWFFIDSSTCQIADMFTCLTGRQTFSFFASDYDPGVTGYAVAVAVDANGRPRDFDFLIGSEYVKFTSGHEANLGAETISMFNVAASFVDVVGSGGSQVELIFDNNGYEQLPSGLAINNFPSPLDTNETMVIINRIGGDLGDKVGNIGIINGLLYNQNERGFSFTSRTESCQLIKILSDSFPRTSPQLTKVISAGTSGWIRMFSSSPSDNNPNEVRTILGAVINRYTFIPVAHNRSFNLGHNLHRLTYNSATRLRMPVIAPAGC